MQRLGVKVRSLFDEIQAGNMGAAQFRKHVKCFSINELRELGRELLKRYNDKHPFVTFVRAELASGTRNGTAAVNGRERKNRLAG